VVEVTFCNSISVAEHVVMMILSLVRNYMPSYKQVRVSLKPCPSSSYIRVHDNLVQVLDGGWNIADCVKRSYDLEGMHVSSTSV
jgi:formate dehydrogenase